MLGKGGVRRPIYELNLSRKLSRCRQGILISSRTANVPAFEVLSFQFLELLVCEPICSGRGHRREPFRHERAVAEAGVWA